MCVAESRFRALNWDFTGAPAGRVGGGDRHPSCWPGLWPGRDGVVVRFAASSVCAVWASPGVPLPMWLHESACMSVLQEGDRAPAAPADDGTGAASFCIACLCG